MTALTDPVPFSDLVEACRRRPPVVGMVLGSGMGFVVDRMRVVCSVPFWNVPGLTAAGVPGHRGQMTLAEWHGSAVLVHEGRLHYYEGHSWERVTLPVRTAAALGVRVMLHTNAAGGIHEALSPGSLMAVADHIELTRPFWWRHPGPGGLGTARESPYSARLLDVLDRAATGQGLRLHRGTYACLTGPSYETPAEIRALRHWGADAVGMSTAREVEAGVEAGMECAALSLITNKAAGLSEGPLEHAEVMAAAAQQSERLASLLRGFLMDLSDGYGPL